MPVVGLFDHSKNDWAGHAGAGLVNAYGYCKEFLGWQPYIDTDGISRDYAIFSIVLFSNYFSEASHIIGKAQSMELSPASITGAWRTLPDCEDEVYVYDTAKMASFCLLGDSQTPCFS